MPTAIEDVMAALAAYDPSAPDPAASVSAPPSDPVADEFSWESQPAPSFDPSQWDGAAENPEIQMPAADVHPAIQQVAAGYSTGKSHSFSGVTDDGIKRSKGIFGGINADVANDMKPIDARLGAEGAAATQHYSDMKGADLEGARVERDHLSRVAQLEDQISDSNQGFADLERRIYADGRVERQKILAGYEEQLGGVRALAAQSGNPLVGMGTGGMTQMSGAMFAQGFLAAQGIHIDVGGQIDKWVDRSIAEHQQKIQNAQEGAAGQLHLYQLARESSNDDFEGRQRFRGFTIEAMKGQMQLEAARFGSQMAMARAQHRSAELDLELDTVKSNIGQRHEAAYVQHHAARLNETKAMADAAHQKASEGLQWAEHARMVRKDAADNEAKKAAASAKPEKPSGLLKFVDPGVTTRDANGRVTQVKQQWGVDPSATSEQQNAATKAANDAGVKYSQITAATKILRDLRPPAQDDMTEVTSRFTGQVSPEFRRYERAKTLAVMGVRHAIAGASLTDSEKKEWDGLLANDSLFQRGGNAEAVDQLEKQYRDQYISVMNQTAGIVPLDEADQGDRAVNNAANDTDVSYNANLHGARRSMSPVDTATAGAVAVGHDEVDIEGGFSQGYLDFTKKTGNNDSSGRAGNREHRRGQSREIDSIDTLAGMILKPEVFLHDDQADTVDGKSVGTGTSPDEMRSGALSALRTIADGKNLTGGKTPDKSVQLYAQHALAELSDPWASSNPDAVFRKYASKVQPDNEQLDERATRDARDMSDGSVPGSSINPNRM